MRDFGILIAAAAIVWVTNLPCFGQAEKDWFSRSKVFRSKYYSVRTDFPEEEAKALAKHMDATCDAYIAMFKGLANWRQSRLDLWLFQKQDDYLNALLTKVQVDGTGSQGMCISRGNQILLVGWRGTNGDDRMRGLLQHEGFHQFARFLFDDLPTWANEGLAEVFERGISVDGKVVIGEVSEADKKRLADALEDGFKPFDELFTIESEQWGADVISGQASHNYLQAWSIVHFFLWAEDGKYQKPFLKFLKVLNQGAEWRQAWVAAFGRPNFAVMEKKWRDYATNLDAHDYRETIRRMDFLAQGMLSLMESDIRVGTFDELKQALIKAEFQHTSKLFGESQELSASDETSFEIPNHAEFGAECGFELLDSRGRKPRPGARPSTVPMRIATSGLKPFNFSVHWTRKGRTYVPSFHIE